MNLVIDELIIEVTRVCQMDCIHCLRGPSRLTDNTMEFQTIKPLLDQIKQIGTLTFSGGEPSLNPLLIQHIVDYIIQKNIQVDDFFIATNGLVYNPDFVKALNQLYDYCNEYNNLTDPNRLLWPEEKSPELDHEIHGCSLTISRDEYHDPIPVLNYIKYMSLPYFTKDKEIAKRNFGNNQRIIRRGNADLNGIGHEQDVDKFDFEINETSTNIQLLYVDVNGGLHADCNMSYDMEDTLAYGKTTDSVIETMKNLAKE